MSVRKANKSVTRNKFLRHGWDLHTKEIALNNRRFRRYNKIFRVY